MLIVVVAVFIVGGEKDAKQWNCDGQEVIVQTYFWSECIFQTRLGSQILLSKYVVCLVYGLQ